MISSQRLGIGLGSSGGSGNSGFGGDKNKKNNKKTKKGKLFSKSNLLGSYKKFGDR
jgi:hypothetical protein